MRCPSCYQPVGDDDRNCPHCGTSLSMFNPPASHPAAGFADDAAVSYAGFWRRVAAYLVDSLVLGFGTVVVVLPLMLMGAVDRAAIGQHENLFNLLSVVIGWLYFALQESSDHQATLGKRLFGMQVTDTSGQRIGFGRATGRYFAKLVSAVLLLIGFIMVAFTRRKQGLHDMIADTLVTNRPGSSPRTGCALVIALGFILVIVLGIFAAISVPAYQEYLKRARAAQEAGQGQASPEEGGESAPAAGAAGGFAEQADMAADAVESSYAREGTLPASVEEAQLAVDPASGGAVMTIGNGGVVTLFSHDGQSHLTMVPQVAGDGSIIWMCAAEGLRAADFPARCRQQ